MKLLFAVGLLAFLSVSCAAVSWGGIFGSSSSEPKKEPSPSNEQKSAPHTKDLGKYETSGSISKTDGLRNQDMQAVQEVGLLEKPLPEDTAPETSISQDAANPTSHHRAAEHSVESSLRKRSFAGVDRDNEGGSVLNSKPRAAAVSGEGHKLREGTYPSISKELRETSRPLGPSVEGMQSNDVGGRVDDVLGSHTSLTQGIEQAIAGLTSIYNTLRSSSDSEAKGHDAEMGQDPDAHTLSTTEHSSALQSSSGEKNLISPEMSPSSANSSILSNSSDSSGADAKTGSTDKGLAGDKAGGGVSTFTILGGVAFVAAVGVFLIGYSQSQDAASPPTPLYPPKGPAFV